MLDKSKECLHLPCSANRSKILPSGKVRVGEALSLLWDDLDHDQSSIWYIKGTNKSILGKGFFGSFDAPLSSGFIRVLENLESPGILFWHFPGLESPGKRPLVQGPVSRKSR